MHAETLALSSPSARQVRTGLFVLVILMAAFGVPLLAHRSKFPDLWGFSRVYLLCFALYIGAWLLILAAAVLAAERVARLFRIRLVQRAALGLSGIVVGCVLMEGILALLPEKLWNPDPAVRVGATFAVPDRLFHHIPPANSRAVVDSPYGEFKVDVQINSEGLRDVEHAVAKPPGTLRILLLGDSMVQAMQVTIEDTAARRLEPTLTRATGRHVEVINAGVASYSPTLEYLMLKNKGLKYAPDIVLLMFFPADVADDWGYAEDLQFDEHGVPLMRKPRESSLWRDLLPAVYGQSRVIKFFVANMVMQGRRTPPPLAVSIFEPEYTAREWGAWEITKTSLRAANDLTAAHGARFGLVVFPYQFQVEPGDAAPKSNILLKSTRPERILAEFSREHGMPFLDLLPVFRQAGVHPLFFAHDQHLTPLGHEVTSDALAAFVEKAILPTLGPTQASAGPAGDARH
jgi:hypothetical protein